MLAILDGDFRGSFGGFDEVAIHLSRDPLQFGTGVLLLAGGEPLVFVKVRESAAAQRLAAEWAALTSASGGANGFRVPEPVARGSSDGFDYIGLSPLPPKPHVPERSTSLADLTEAIRLALDGIGKPNGVPDHWEPMHGDLTPWNVRRVGGEVFVLDWEDSGWGPPGADLVLYRCTAQVLGFDRGRAMDWKSPSFAEARSFWIQAWCQRIEDERRSEVRQDVRDEGPRRRFALDVVAALQA